MSGILAGLGSLVGPLGDFASTLLTNKRNEKLTRESWRREDTAVQRRMRDLEAAGLNPVLAAGGVGSGSSAPIRMEAPKIGDIGGKFISASIASNQMAQTKADAQRAGFEANKSGYESMLAKKKYEILNKTSDLLPPEANGMTLLEYQMLQDALRSGSEVRASDASTALAGSNMAKVLFDLKLAQSYGDATKIVELITKSIGIFK